MNVSSVSRLWSNALAVGSQGLTAGVAKMNQWQGVYSAEGPLALRTMVLSDIDNVTSNMREAAPEIIGNAARNIRTINFRLPEGIEGAVELVKDKLEYLNFKDVSLAVADKAQYAVGKVGETVGDVFTLPEVALKVFKSKDMPLSLRLEALQNLRMAYSHNKLDGLVYINVLKEVALSDDDVSLRQIAHRNLLGLVEGTVKSEMNGVYAINAFVDVVNESNFEEGYLRGAVYELIQIVKDCRSAPAVVAFFNLLEREEIGDTERLASMILAILESKVTEFADKPEAEYLKALLQKAKENRA